MNHTVNASASDEKHHMIETAAYYRAEKRGFSSGDPMADWIEAEREINASLQRHDDPATAEHETAAYRRLRAEFKKIMAGTQERISADSVKKAFDRAGRELKQLGEFFPDTVDRAGRRLRQEVAAAVEKTGYRWDSLADKSHEIFDDWKDRGDQFVRQASTALNDRVKRFRRKEERDKK